MNLVTQITALAQMIGADVKAIYLAITAARENAGIYANESTFIGQDTPKQNAATTARNVYVGSNAGASSNSGATHNVGIGSYALWKLVAGVLNVALGTDTLEWLTTGLWNTALGSKALRFLQTGDYNTAAGHNSLVSLLTGSGNTAVGQGSSSAQTSGSNGISVGIGSGANNLTGGYNIFIGSYAGFNQDGLGQNGSFNVVIGAENRIPSNSNNVLNICNLIKGGIGANKLGFNGKEPITAPTVTDLPTFAQALHDLGLINLQVGEAWRMDLEYLIDIDGNGGINDDILFGGN